MPHLPFALAVWAKLCGQGMTFFGYFIQIYQLLAIIHSTSFVKQMIKYGQRLNNMQAIISDIRQVNKCRQLYFL